MKPMIALGVGQGWNIGPLYIMTAFLYDELNENEDEIDEDDERMFEEYRYEHYLMNYLDKSSYK